MTTKQILNRLNNAFFSIISESPKNVQAVRKVNEQIIQSKGKNIKQIIQDSDIDFESLTELYLVLSAVMAVINKSKDKEFELIAMFLGLYTSNRPELLAYTIFKTLTSRNLDNKQVKAKVLLKRWLDSIPEIEKKKIIQGLQRVEIRQRSEMFRDVEFDKLTKEELEEKYKDSKRVERALRTELHEQFEQTKTEVMKSFGYTHKMWVTQKDNRVRDTAWHNSVANKEIPIDSDFRASGFRASHPGDVMLPIGERINCRCYLIYTK